MDEHLGDQRTNDVDALAKDTERLAIVRKTSVGCLVVMRALSEPIARIAIKTTSAPARFGKADSKPCGSTMKPP